MLWVGDWGVGKLEHGKRQLFTQPPYATGILSTANFFAIFYLKMFQNSAGVVAKTVTAPLDRVRLIYQVTPSKVYSFRCAIELAQDIARLAGPQGLWYGHMATVYRVVPFAGVQFLMFETVQKRLAKMPRAKTSPFAPFWIPACAGASAAVTATIATYPLDVIRTRIAGHLEAVPRYRNYSAAVQGIIQIEGFQGLFRGLSPTLLGIGPYGALSFSAFEFSKGKLRQWHRALDVGWHLLFCVQYFRKLNHGFGCFTSAS